MRAPPESLRPTTGAPIFTARSMILTIFAALVSESEPPNTVKSCANAKTSRPLTRPPPATPPAAGPHLTGHAEVAAPVGDERIDLLECRRIEQMVDALSRRQAPRLALA